MAFTFDPIFAADPSNAANVASNAAITIYDPNDPGKAPITITDPTDSPISNPITVNKNGFGPAFKHATLDRVGWSGGGFEGFFTSYEGLKNEAVAARQAAETAGADAAAEAAAGVASVVADADAAAASAAASATAAANSAALVNAPADSAIAAAINGTGTQTKAALSATVAPKVDRVAVPARQSGSRFRTLTILVYHGINQTNFNIDLDFYQEWNYTTVHMQDVQDHLDGISTLPDKPLLITFDDGIPSQYTAAQTLNSRGMKGTLFVATGWIDGGVTQAAGGFAESTPLTWDQIRQMKTWGIEIQSHTDSHQDQTSLTAAQVATQFTYSKARIEAEVPGQVVHHMAYPYGAWNETVRAALVGAGCKLARQVRTAADGSYPGPNKGRYAIASTLSDKHGIPCAGASNGDIQQPNYYRSLSHDPELIPDFGFEAGGKGWNLGTGFTVDTTDAYAGTKSLHVVQGTSTVSSRPTRAIYVGNWARAQLRARIKTVGLPTGTLTKLQFQPLKADGTVITTTDAIVVTGNNGAWNEYTYEYVGTSDVHTVLVYAWLQGNAAPTGAAWFDAVSLKRESANAPFGGLF